MILRTRTFIFPFTLKFSVLNVQLKRACSVECRLGIDNELELHLLHGEAQGLASLKCLMPTVISLFPFYILFNPKLVERGNRIFFQITNTPCLVQNDHLLTVIGGKEKFCIRLAI